MLSSSENEFLEKVNILMEFSLTPKDKDGAHFFEEELILNAARHLCLSKHAKRARPLICYYFSRLLESENPAGLAEVAIAAEFIHQASLLHDDIIDNADKRRGQSTTNRIFGDKIAVLAGDYLLTEGFLLLMSHERCLTDRAINVVRAMTVAAIKELSSRGKIDLLPADVREIALGKTGVLFGFCGYAVGIISKNIAASELLWSMGEHIGLIFQLSDDIKDFDGDKALKDICRDLRNLEPSMPMVLAMEINPVIKRRVVDLHAGGIISEVEAQELKDLVLGTEAIKATRAIRGRELDAVLTLLSKFPDGLGKEGITNFIDTLAY